MLTQTLAGLFILILFGVALYVEHKEDERKKKAFMEFGMEQA